MWPINWQSKDVPKSRTLTTNITLPIAGLLSSNTKLFHSHRPLGLHCTAQGLTSCPQYQAFHTWLMKLAGLRIVLNHWCVPLPELAFKGAKKLFMVLHEVREVSFPASPTPPPPLLWLDTWSCLLRWIKLFWHMVEKGTKHSSCKGRHIKMVWVVVL